MKMAKVQKATLDPAKISGRCGRLMCCLRYEDQTYGELKRRLPRRGTRVNTPDGPGSVVNGQILTQLVQVSLDAGRRVVYGLETLSFENVPPPPQRAGPGGGQPARGGAARPDSGPGRPAKRKRRRRRSRRPNDAQRQDAGPAGRPPGGRSSNGGGDSSPPPEAPPQGPAPTG
jgi:hypothetical protein